MAEKKLDIPQETTPIVKPAPASDTTPPPAQKSNPKPVPVKKERKSPGLLGLLIFLIILVLLGYLGYQVYLLIQYQPKTTEEKIELKKTEEFKKIQSTIQYANPVSISEPTGRVDPLAPF